MGAYNLGLLENAVERMLLRNSQLQDQCENLLSEQVSLRRQRREVLAELDQLLMDLELLRKQQG